MPGRKEDCTPCGIGSYADAEGQADCSPWNCCDSGHYNHGASSTTSGMCKPCPQHTWRAGHDCTGQQCYDQPLCSPGEYLHAASPTAEGSCEACVAGQYMESSEHRAIHCDECNAGKFSAQQGATQSTVCQACGLGTYSYEGAAACTACGDGRYGKPHQERTSELHCGQCDEDTTPWSGWSNCTAACGGGMQHNTRSIQPGKLGVEGGCALSQNKTCNTQACTAQPGKTLCVYLKCRFQVGPHGQLAIQVYHHHKDSDLVHHCQLYDAPGVHGMHRKCHCLCDQK